MFPIYITYISCMVYWSNVIDGNKMSVRASSSVLELQHNPFFSCRMLDQYRETFQFIHYLSTEEQCLMKSIVCFFLSNKEKWKELPGFFFHWLMEVDQSGMNWLFTTSMSWLWTKVSLKHMMSNSGLMIHSILDCHAMIQHQVNSSLPKTSPVLGQYVHNFTCCTRAKCCILMSTINVL